MSFPIGTLVAEISSLEMRFFRKIIKFLAESPCVTTIYVPPPGQEMIFLTNSPIRSTLGSTMSFINSPSSRFLSSSFGGFVRESSTEKAGQDTHAGFVFNPLIFSGMILSRQDLTPWHMVAVVCKHRVVSDGGEINLNHWPL